MKFGVYIRSIGERTEALCIESCRRFIDDKDIHVLRNYYPSYNVYREMFLRAKKSNYDWFLGVDADVVLLPNWYEKITKRLDSVCPKTTFKFEFRVYDPIYKDRIYRGNHVYNNAFTPMAIKALKKNIFISKLPKYFKKYFNSGHYLKPETSLRGMLKKKYGLLDVSYDDLIGIHGAEQFFCEIFRTFMVRSQRNPEWVKKYIFLEKGEQVKLLRSGEHDRYVANLGWNYLVSELGAIDARQPYFREIFLKYGVEERKDLLIHLESFYKKYVPIITL